MFRIAILSVHKQTCSFVLTSIFSCLRCAQSPTLLEPHPVLDALVLRTLNFKWAKGATRRTMLSASANPRKGVLCCHVCCHEWPLPQDRRFSTSEQRRIDVELLPSDDFIAQLLP